MRNKYTYIPGSDHPWKNIRIAPGFTRGSFVVFREGTDKRYEVFGMKREGRLTYALLDLEGSGERVWIDEQKLKLAPAA